MRRFFIEKDHITENTASLTGQDARHLKDVLRLNVGDTVLLLDGQGMEYQAGITAIQPGQVDLIIHSSNPRSKESPVSITVAQAFLKDKKMDVLLRQLTELGMTRFLPFYASRSVARPDKDRLKTRMARWETIARESIKQCERTRLPEISDTLSFDAMLNAAGSSDLKIMFWEKESAPLQTQTLEPHGSITILLGPEGGFTDGEACAAKGKGFITASLGPRILKAETASITALSLVQYLFGDMG